MKKLIALAKRILGPTYHPLKKFLDAFLFRYRQAYYSQFGEDIFVSKYFADKPQGTYVDIGAFHPRQFSNTYLLYRKGWSGLVVYATPGSSTLFKWIRPRDIAVECAVSNEKKELTFYNWGNHLENTANEAQAQALFKELGEPLKKQVIPSDTLANLVDKHLKERSVDFASIDVEGLDYEVLTSADWERFKPKVIIVESFKFDLDHIQDCEIFQFLKSKGYKLVSWLKPSLIFERA